MGRPRPRTPPLGAPQGTRFTLAPEAKDELLDRLLKLNHHRYVAEVPAGLHDRRKPKPASRRSTARVRAGGGQGTLV